MRVLFLFCVSVICYTYAGYLLLLTVLSIKKKRINKGDIFPYVSLIVAAYNEEDSIEGKIKNSLKLNYPKEKLEIIVASDCSTDNTDKIVEKYLDKGIKLVRQNQRNGKTAVQNLAVASAKGEILVFSDATTIYDKEALKKMVRNFNDSTVGCVAGVERFVKPEKSLIAEEVSLFWKYEQLLRQKETDVSSIVAVSGCIFAIRKFLHEELSENLVEDLILPLKTIFKGYRVVNEKEAIGYEETVINSEDDYKRKERIVTGGIIGLLYMKHLLNPVRYPILSFQLISHKIFRWLTPFFLIVLFLSNMYLIRNGLFFQVFGFLQILCYLLAGIGYLLRKTENTLKIFKIPYYFCLINAAAAVGVIKFLSGKRQIVWTPVR
ncbi:MAG: glycosyltransferase family 2 protein [Candidatus Aureabacteria bacterium]|nr:glycosyltransferase family 2 protein [Candidatus Auribacterota bacterium]MCK5161921.1 glycosyltransferase family 2 protein [Candidatus Auribacterota bacterium]